MPLLFILPLIAALSFHAALRTDGLARALLAAAGASALILFSAYVLTLTLALMSS